VGGARFGVPPAFARTTLHFVPEPGVFVLLALGSLPPGLSERR
jgi:hypothetical protein